MEGKKFGKYLVTPEGKIFIAEKNYEVRQTLTSGGYKFVVLKLETPQGLKNKSIQTHRLVAELYYGKPEVYSIVLHLDGDKTNNHYTNLKWISNAEHHRANNYKGSREKHWSYKGIYYGSTAELAKYFGVYRLHSWVIDILLDTGTLKEVF